MTEKVSGDLGGSESILFALMDLLPLSTVYAPLINRDLLPEEYKNRKYRTTFIEKMPFSKKFYKAYFPLMPLAIESFDVQEYDGIISSHHCVAKGIIPRPDSIHICYCHSPARYIWDLYWTYARLNRFSAISRIITSTLSHYLRIWDNVSASRVNLFLSNSTYTSQRIQKYYNRRSIILYPPVDTEAFNFESDGDYYLMAGRLIAYKGFELGIEAFNSSGKRLVIVGDGPEYSKLKSKANKNIEMVGKVRQEELVKYFNNCKAFVFPGKEDFGIVMAEAQSAGKPVVAFDAGGAKDIILNNETGILFKEQSIHSINNAIEESEKKLWNDRAISLHAEKFDRKVFFGQMKKYIDNIEDYRSNY